MPHIFSLKYCSTLIKKSISSVALQLASSVCDVYSLRLHNNGNGVLWTRNFIYDEREWNNNLIKIFKDSLTSPQDAYAVSSAHITKTQKEIDYKTRKRISLLSVSNYLPCRGISSAILNATQQDCCDSIAPNACSRALNCLSAAVCVCNPKLCFSAYCQFFV